MGAETGLSVFTKWSSYAITGSTLGELRQLIRLLGPTRNGRTFGAFTDWRIDWWLDVEANTADVRVAGARVDVHAHVLLPRWTRPKSASAALQVEWDRYSAAVETHEQGHVDIAVGTGSNLLSALEKLCLLRRLEEIHPVAKETAETLIAAGREEDVAYDVACQNGAAQGARLVEAFAG